MSPAYNVVLFGETGSGKSSIINMIAQDYDLATISSGAAGCTFQNKSFRVEIMGATFNIYDTSGLNEGDAGKIPKQEAIVQLYKLLCDLKEGVSLLIFCMRGPRIKDATHKNWILFYEIICKKKVPIVIAITGLENEDPMDDWWYRNKGAFQRYEMNPSGFACITATKGKQRSSGKFVLEEEYEESKQKMWRLIKAHHLEVPWKVERIKWFTNIITTTYETKWCFFGEEHEEVRRVAGEAVGKLIERCEISKEQANELAELLERA